ncbi:serpin B3-like [Drosophila busckii]|uniref:serpin B3-like n=1 Tax=Drosophila busckii TaxID=30019 RepID=UPI001432CED5|nr:serpin B3-like [Drosophila busckii]
MQLAVNVACTLLIYGLNQVCASFLTEVLRRNGDDNVVVSPFLFQEALMQLYAGAEGSTAKELKHVLQLKGHGKERLLEEYVRQRGKTVVGTHNIRIKMSNKLYAAKGMNIFHSYQQEVQKLFGSTVEFIDFEQQKALKKINVWVSQQTSLRLHKAIDEIDPFNKLILVAVGYFQADWAQRFDKTETRQADFVRPDGNIMVHMMHNQLELELVRHHELDATIFALPFSGLNFSMLVLLPHEADGLAKLTRQLAQSDTDPQHLLNNSERTVVQLFMPRFKFEYKIDLMGVGKRLGLKHIFESANLQTMTAASNLQLSSIWQTTGIVINEFVGSHYSANEIKLVARTALPTINVNHPFIFYIKDNTNVYFAGRVSNP